MSYAEIRLINKDTDLSKLEMHELDWDVSVRGKEYKVFRIPGYIHCIGGRWGNNDYWACPRDEEPTTRNLAGFNGVPVQYSISIREGNYHEHKWDEHEIRSTVWCVIYRNDKEFYSFCCREVPYAFAKAHLLIESEIYEGVINYNRYNYAEKEIIGRHIWWRGKPYTLGSYIEGQCCAMAVPGHVEIKSAEQYWKEYSGLCDNHVKLDLLEDKNISWFNPEY